MPPQRIASLLASSTEMLYGLGLGDRVVAVSHECDYPVDANRKPRVTFTHVEHQAASGEIDRQVRERITAGDALYEIDVETLTQLAPDLIVTQSQCDVCAVRYADVVETVRNQPQLSGTQIVDLDPRTFDDVFNDILKVGAAAGVEDKARTYVANLKARVKAIADRAEAIPAAQRRKVACIEWIEPLMLAANWMPELIAAAGGIGPREAGQHSTYTKWEELLEFAPDVVAIMPCGFGLPQTLSEVPLLQAREGWDALPAVKQGRVTAVDGNAYFNRSGPRMVDSLEILAHLIYPETFTPPASVPNPADIWQAIP